MQRSNSADSWWCHSPNSIRPTNTTARFSLTPLPSFPLFSFLSSLFDRGYPRDQQPLIDTPIEDADPFVIPLLFYSRWRIIYAAIRLQDSSTGFDRFLSIGFAFAIDRFPWIGKLAYDR